MIAHKDIGPMIAHLVIGPMIVHLVIGPMIAHKVIDPMIAHKVIGHVIAHIKGYWPVIAFHFVSCTWWKEGKRDKMLTAPL